MFKIMPKTASIKEMQKNYRFLFDEVLKNQEPYVILNNNKPEIVLLDVKTYEKIMQSKENWEISQVDKAIASAEEDKKNGTYIKADSLADLLKM